MIDQQPDPAEVPTDNYHEATSGHALVHEAPDDAVAAHFGDIPLEHVKRGEPYENPQGGAAGAGYGQTSAPHK